MKRLLALLKPYTVEIHGSLFDGTTHRAWTYADALGWARCYRQTHCLEVHIRTRSGRLAGRLW